MDQPPDQMVEFSRFHFESIFDPWTVLTGNEVHQALSYVEYVAEAAVTKPIYVLKFQVQTIKQQISEG